MSSTPTSNLQLAKRGPIVSIVAYLLISIAKLIVGYSINSSSLIADGFNNVSDILSNVTLLIGLHLASKPADEDHRFGHWKIEDLASLITSFIMFIVGFQVLSQTIHKIISGTTTTIDPQGAIVGVVSAIIMYGVYLYNRRLSKKVKSSALVAAAKDNLSDAVASIGTSVAIIAASFHLVIIDRLAAIVITYFILKTAYDIFMESAFSLSDGFDDKELKKYKEAILKLPKVTAVKSLRGRSYGSNIYLDIVVEMNPDLSVYESHEITEQIERLLNQEFSIYDTDVHVEPAAIPEDEIWENVYHRLQKNEKIILSKIPDYEELLADNFRLISDDGQTYSKEEMIARQRHYVSQFEDFEMTSISQKTKLITYTLGGEAHTSIWRRQENWYLVFHQITPKK